MIRKKRLLRLAQQLIRIDSQNPPGNEQRIAQFVREHLAGCGLRARSIAYKKGRTNVLASLPAGGARAKELLITPHLDTVPAGRSWKEAPFGARLRDGKLYGLGATDCKVNLAVALEVIQSFTEERLCLPYTLTFAATADEESGSELGLLPLLAQGVLKPDAAVVLDADDFTIIIAQKGLMHLKVRVKGKKAHGAYPWLGRNAIDDSLSAINALHSGMKTPNRRHRYLRPPTVNVGTITGGDKVNVVADWCEFELDFRYLPRQKEQQILKNLKKILAKYTQEFTIEIEGSQDPYEIEESHPLVSGLKTAIRQAGLCPAVTGSEGATVITFFQHRHIPAVATGFGTGGCAHMADEYVLVDNLYRGADVLDSFLRQYRF